jgi:hypothetical protein
VVREGTTLHLMSMTEFWTKVKTAEGSYARWAKTRQDRLSSLVTGHMEEIRVWLAAADGIYRG